MESYVEHAEELFLSWVTVCRIGQAPWCPLVPKHIYVLYETAPQNIEFKLYISLCCSFIGSVQLFESFFFICANFPSWLIAGDSDHLCAGRDRLLIEEWKQFGAFPSQPITVRWRPSCEGLKEVENITQVALSLSLNLSLAHWKPLSPLIASKKLWSV